MEPDPSMPPPSSDDNARSESSRSSDQPSALRAPSPAPSLLLREPILRVATSDDEPALLELFRPIVAAGEGYPQDPDEPVTASAFHAYWVAPAMTVWVAESDGKVVGSFTMKPNGVGRAAHVANAGFIVARKARGRGLGRQLVEHAMEQALSLGFDAMQFNFVFANNPARALYERLGFRVVGEVPNVIDGAPVLIYWREL